MKKKTGYIGAVLPSFLVLHLNGMNKREKIGEGEMY
jgi:hypothetical protein